MGSPSPARQADPPPHYSNLLGKFLVHYSALSSAGASSSFLDFFLGFSSSAGLTATALSATTATALPRSTCSRITSASMYFFMFSTSMPYCPAILASSASTSSSVASRFSASTMAAMVRSMRT